jgi:hypothetical protein
MSGYEVFERLPFRFEGRLADEWFTPLREKREAEKTFFSWLVGSERIGA